MLLGGLIAAIAIGGNVLVYSSVSDRTEVLQIVRDVPAGEIVTEADLRIVEVDVDPTVPTVAPARIADVVNRYARVHLASGTLMVDVLVQPEPLVTAGQSVVAIEIPATRLPSGLRERSRVMLVVAASDGTAELVTEGRIVSDGAGAESGELLALSVEVRQDEAARLAAASEVRIALLDPGSDPAVGGGER